MSGSKNSQRLEDSILGCLLGLACGDAMGMPTEFLTPAQIVEYHGHVNGFVAPHPGHIHAGMPAGRVTDDTGQALALLNAAIQARGLLTPKLAASALLEWAQSLGAEFNLVAGPSTRRSIALLRRGIAPAKAGRKGRTNGAAMRASVAGLLCPGDPKRALQTAYDISVPTHGTSSAIAGAAAVACAVARALVPASSLESVLAAAKTGAECGSRMGAREWGTSLEKRIELAQLLVEKADDPQAALRALYNYVGVDILVAESVATAFGLVWLAKGDPVQAILMSTNLGGDTDTMGAIAGSICGAWKGAKAFPAEWIRTLEKVNHIELAPMAAELTTITAASYSNE